MRGWLFFFWFLRKYELTSKFRSFFSNVLFIFSCSWFCMTVPKIVIDFSVYLPSRHECFINSQNRFVQKKNVLGIYLLIAFCSFQRNYFERLAQRANGAEKLTEILLKSCLNGEKICVSYSYRGSEQKSGFSDTCLYTQITGIGIFGVIIALRNRKKYLLKPKSTFVLFHFQNLYWKNSKIRRNKSEKKILNFSAIVQTTVEKKVFC